MILLEIVVKDQQTLLPTASRSSEGTCEIGPSKRNSMILMISNLTK